MSSIIFYPLIIGVATGLWALSLWLLGVFTPSEVSAWRHISALRGYGSPDSALERAAGRIPFMARLAQNTDISRLLAIASRPETVLQFWLKAAGVGFFIMAVTLGLDTLGLAAQGSWPAPPFVPVILGVAMLPLSFVRLQRQARRVVDDAELTLGDMLMMAASLAGPSKTPVAYVLRDLSECARTSALYEILVLEGWRKVLPPTDPHISSEDWFRLIGETYGIPTFVKLAETLASADIAQDSDGYTQLPLRIYKTRLLDAKQWAAQAKTLVVIPVALMLIPLLTLLGVPLFAALSQSLK